MKEKLRAMANEKISAVSLISRFAFWLAVILYFEGLLHIVVYESVSLKILYILGFSAGFAGVLTLASSFLPRKADLTVTVILTAVLMVLYGSQLIYKFIFGTLYSVSQVQQGGAALTSFWKETVATVQEKLGYILLLFLPLVSVAVLWRKRKWNSGPINWFWRGAAAAAVILSWGITILCLGIGGTGYFTDYYFYYSSDTTTTQTAERFGLLTALRLELTATQEVAEAEEEDYFSFDAEPETEPVEDVESTAPEEEAPTEPGYNVLEIDFDALNELTENETIETINNYCAGLSGTQKNEYTGMLRNYNLIYICAESFSPAAIDPELTPTLYKLANSGIVFENYYTTYPNNTTDGEYSLVMGLYPDSTRGKTANSFYASRNSYLPYTLGTIFTEQAGIQTYGYHNYLGSFYGRDETHTNMGYTMKFARDGMTFTSSWPASDLEMMEQSADDYITANSQFHAYYMTFSGHYKYTPGVNPMVDRNWSLVKEQPYSQTAKAYLSCNIELDKALEYLMQRLEEAGVADRTAIVLAADHFPYGLPDRQYAELVDYDVDVFTKYRSTLIFWVGGLEEPIVVEEYCSNVDVLPTVLNLWGFEYDSRLLAGTDVFSDGTHVAVLSDKSFFTDKVWFHASSGKTRYLVDESELPEDYVENMIKYVKTKFTLSANILNTAYYNFLYEQGDVKINRKGWISQEEWNKTFNVVPEEEEPEEVPEETETEATEAEKPEESEGTEGTEATETTGEATQAPTEEPTTEPTEKPTEAPSTPVVNSGAMKIGTNSATLEEGSSGFYFSWKAPADGLLTIQMNSSQNGAGWFYRISNLTSGVGGGKHASTDANPMPSQTVEVKEGDRIQVVVGTCAGSGKVTFTARFEEIPEETEPETSIPEETEPETSVPEETVPETAVPEETTPETSVPEENVPATTHPVETEPETTVPEATETPAETQSTEPAQEPTETVE